MEASRTERVRVIVAGSIAVEITWPERRWLVKKINVVPGYETIVRKFEAAGTNSPVSLDADEQIRLLAPLEFWQQELTDGLALLLTAIVEAHPNAGVR